MKILRIFLIISIVVGKSVGMEKDNSDYEFMSKDEHINLQTIHGLIRTIKFHILQKDVKQVISLLRVIKKRGERFSKDIKEKINNEIIKLIIDFLPVPENMISFFEAEHYPPIFMSLSRISSNDISPRIEDNIGSFDEKVETGDEESEVVSKQISNSVRKKPLLFLARIIHKLEDLETAIEVTKGQLRLYTLDKKFESFKRDCECYEGLIDFDDRNGISKALIHYAVENDAELIVDFLLKKGADREIFNMNYMTPLFLAIEKGSENSMQCLLQRGANPYMSNKRFKASRVVALSHEETESSMDVIIASAIKSRELKKYLKNYAADLPIDIKFRFCAQAGKLVKLKKMLKNLEERDTIVNSVDKNDGKSALHYAIERQKTDVIKFFLNEFHFDLDLQDLKGNTPLHYAVIGNYFEGVLLLLYGLDLDASNNFIRVALDKRNKQGYTPGEIAKLLEYDDILKLLESENCDNYTLKQLPIITDDLWLDVQLIDLSEKLEEKSKVSPVDSDRKARRKSRKFSFSTLKKVIKKNKK